MNRILKRLSQYRTIYRILQIVYYTLIVRPYCFVVLFFYNLKLFLISKKFISEGQQYKRIKELKDIYKGKRCFIVATGPSVRMKDLESIRNEVTISMNSIVNILDKTSYRPTYYMIQDYTVFIKNYENIRKLPEETVKLLGISNIRRPDLARVKKLIKTDKTFWLYRDNSAALAMVGDQPTEKTNIGFSWDCGREIMDGYTVTYSAIQLAVWMGITEIYLIGCDCDYSQKVNHIGEYNEETHEYSNKTVERMMHSYECAYSNLIGKVKIFNATRGGHLEIFPRVNLDEIISEKAEQMW